MKVIFMGTPDFSVGILEELIASGHEIVLAVTQPDKPNGRGNNVTFPPVKQAALDHGIEVFQPKKIREEENIEFLKKYAADIMIVAAFGQILPKVILEMTPYGCVNVHASLLPKYRGAAPIQWAVINGEEVSGVTIMQMDEGIDTGDMILKQQVALDENETGGSLFDKLAVVGAKLCVEAMSRLENKTATFTKQEESLSSHTKMIQKQFGKIDWTLPAINIERLIRGLNPWPSAYTVWNDKTLKIWKAKVIAGGDSAKAGYIHTVTKKEILIQTGEGLLCLEEVQLQGKKRMAADAFLRGNEVEVGSRLE